MSEPRAEGALEVGGGEPELAAGARVGRYRVEALLGRGGMGAVYEAEDEALGRRVALKVLTQSAGASEIAGDARARLLREARAVAALDHPNVVAVFDVGEHEGAPFFAMELVAGTSMRARMSSAADPPTLDDKLRWLEDIGRALEAAHAKGIVHRDVKPRERDPT